MTEDQNAVARQETPVEETPSAEVASEEQIGSEGTPAQPNPEDNDAGTADGKTPEQLKADAAYHQTEAQKAKFDAKQAQEELAALKQADVLGDYDNDAPAPLPQAPRVDAAQQNRIESMSDEELNQFVQENPALLLEAQRIQFEKVLSQRDQVLLQKQAAAQEREQANRTLNRWMTENDVSRDEIEAARTQLKSFGIKAPPAGIASMIITQVNNNRVQNNIMEKSVQAQAKASQAVKVQALTQQPTSQTGDTRGGPKTPDQVIKEKFGKERKPTGIDKIFGAA